jgi:SNF2 family DNA or RNA helicase
LRRTKESKTDDGQPLLVLPPKEILERRVALSNREKEAYYAVKRETKRMLELFIHSNQKGCMSLLLVALLRLRQICAHASLAPDALMAVQSLVQEMESKKVISEESKERALSVLQGADQCPVCLDDFTTMKPR